MSFLSHNFIWLTTEILSYAHLHSVCVSQFAFYTSPKDLFASSVLNMPSEIFFHKNFDLAYLVDFYFYRVSRISFIFIISTLAYVALCILVAMHSSVSSSNTIFKILQIFNECCGLPKND